MNTKFTILANGDSGKSLTLKVLQYLILRDFCVIDLYKYTEVKGNPRKLNEQHLSTHTFSDFSRICPTADLRVLNVIKCDNREVLILICSPSDIEEQVIANWTAYKEAEGLCEGRDVIFISPCHYKDKKEYRTGTSYVTVSFDVEETFIKKEKFFPVCDFVLSARKYSPHMDVCIYRDTKSVVNKSITFWYPSDSEIDAILSEMNKLPLNPFRKFRGEIAHSDVQKNAIHRALVLEHELKEYIKLFDVH